LSLKDIFSQKDFRQNSHKLTRKTADYHKKDELTQKFLLTNKKMANDLIFKEEVYAIVGAALEVYNHLGPGFLEAVYQETLEIELAARKIPFVPQLQLQIAYKGKPLKTYYAADFLVFDQIILEIKALTELSPRETAQVLNEIKAANLPLGLLINFGNPDKLEWKRLANTKHIKNFSED
jgi:GxxExxY protein